MTPQILAVNVAVSASLLMDGRSVASAIRKRSVSHRVTVRRLGLEGDEQADLSVHGGLTKAVYAFPSEHYPTWQTMRAQAQAAAWDRAMPHGQFGENLTLVGLQESQLWIGDRWVLPDCELLVSEPRKPCDKFAHVMGFKHAVKMMAQSGHCGAYLAVLHEGSVGAGDAITVIPGPREVSIVELFKSAMRKIKDT